MNETDKSGSDKLNGKREPTVDENSRSETEWNANCGSVREQCSVFQRGSELLGKRWTGVIIYMLLQQPTYRFNELLTAVHGISDRLLTERLRELEENGLVERVVIPESPVRVEYHLTEAGRDAHEIVAATYRWSNRWFQPTTDGE
jgi:DNA-binding HxlR family transcriptional regulator